MALFNEGLVLQNHVSSRPPYCHCDDQHRSGRFAHLMMEGRVNAALRCLAPTCNCGPLSLDHVVGSHSDGSSKTVYDVLKDKHPSGRAADPALVLDVSESSSTFHLVLFDGLDAALIRTVALQISGAAGPSRVDARSWRLFVPHLALLLLISAMQSQLLAAEYLHHMPILLVLLLILLAV